MPIERQKLEKKFSKKLGLYPEEGSDHRLFVFVYKEEEIATVPISRSYNTISDDILGQMAGQLYVKLGTLKRAVDCRLSVDSFCQEVKRGWQLKYGRP